MYGNNSEEISLVVKSLILIPTAQAYSPVPQRPMEVSGDGNVFDRLGQVLTSAKTHKGYTISDLTIPNDVNDLVGLAAVPIGVASIQNGWGEQRLRFILIVEYGDTTYYLQGYSEYYSPTIHGSAVDPEQSFSINSIVNTRTTRNPINQHTNTRVISSYNVVTDQYGGDSYAENNVMGLDSRLWMCRPSDVYDELSAMELYHCKVANCEGVEADYHVMESYQGVLDSSAYASNRRNNDCDAYITSVLNSHIKSGLVTDHDGDSLGRLQNAARVAVEEDISDCAFIMALQDLSNVPNPTTFTLSMLEVISPGFNYDLVMLDIPYNDVSPDHESVLGKALETIGLEEPTYEVLTASMVHNALITLMVENFVTTISMYYTNYDVQEVCVVTDIGSFINVSDSVDLAVNRIKSAFLQRISPKMTRMGECRLSLEICASVTGDTTIRISVEGGALETIRIPTFGDSLYTPIVNSLDGKTRLSGDLVHMMDMCRSQDY